MRLKYLYIAVCFFISSNASGQSRRQYPLAEKTDTAFVPPPPQYIASVSDSGETFAFCNALLQLLKDAELNFEATKGKFVEANDEGIRWTAVAGLPNAITSDLLRQGTRWQYEGVMYLGNSKTDMARVYSRYSGFVHDCMPARGYETKSLEKNGVAKLLNYPTLGYSRPAVQGAEVQPPHVTLKADYADLTDTYTITITVWSN